jgi:CO/xanthine dehydrogenase Mo-binding subunit
VKQAPSIRGVSHSGAVGRSIPMVDGPDKVTGRTIYGTDYSRQGTLVGVILRSPYAHARIESIDTSKAKALPGVAAVITGSDIPNRTFGFHSVVADRLADKMALQRDKVRFIGDEVAAVAAIDLATAREAIQLIEVEYDLLDPVFDPRMATAPDAPKIHESIDHNVIDELHFGSGDTARGFAEAEIIVENEFHTQPVSPAAMETHQAMAEWDARRRLTMYASTQMPFMLRSHLAALLGLSEGQVRIVKMPMGGGFGSRMEMHPIDPICALLAKKAGRPVKITYSREEEFLSTSHRHPFTINGRIGARSDGTMTALELEFLIDSGAYVAQALGVARVGAINAATLYRIPNTAIHSRTVYTNKPYPSAFRGYGNTQATFALECLVDELAEKLGIDAVDLRLQNGNRPNTETALGQLITSCGYHDALMRGRDASQWAETRRRRRRRDGKAVGIGVATTINVGGGARDRGGSDASGAIVVMRDDGSASVITGGQEIGTGGMTAFTQIAAQELGIPVQQITVSNSDTDVIPWDLGCHAQRNVFCAGNGVLMAAREAREELLRQAEAQFEISADDLVLEEGQVYVRGTADPLGTISDVVKRAHLRQGSSLVWGRGFYDPPTEQSDSRGHGNKSGAYSFGAQFITVEVDLETGIVDVIDVVAAHDVGKAINPAGVAGQIHGGVVQGIGQALSEEMVYSEGQLMNPYFATYLLPNALDSPPIEAIIVESNDPEGPYGAKGVGECTIVPTCAAIANAVYDAIGVRFTDLPIRPWQIQAALANNGATR